MKINEGLGTCYILKIINKNSVLHRNAAVISCKK